MDIKRERPWTLYRFDFETKGAEGSVEFDIRGRSVERARKRARELVRERLGHKQPRLALVYPRGADHDKEED